MISLCAGPEDVGFEIEIASDLMRMLVRKLSDPHVRLVFDIEGA